MTRLMGRVIRGLLIALGLLALAAAVALYVVFETQRGHDFLLRVGLERAHAAIDGRIEVGGIHSRGILRGLTLTDVSLTERTGGELFRADSVRVGYSLIGFLRGDVILSPVELWSPRVRIERLPGEDDFNVDRLLPPEEEPAPPEPTSERRRIALERVTIHDAEVVVRVPLEEGEEPMERAVLEEGPAGGLLQRFAFTAIEGELPQVLVREPGADGEFIRVARLSMDARVLEEPFPVTDFRGWVERVGTRLTFDADRIWLERSELAGTGALDWGGDVLDLELDLDAGVLELTDLHWVLPDLPAVTGRLSLRTSGLLDAGLWEVHDADLELDGSRVTGSGAVQLGEEIRLVGVDVVATPLALGELERFLEAPLPLEGWLRGQLRADGPLRALAVDGEVSLEEAGAPRPPSTAVFAGVLHIQESFGFSDLSLLVDPFDFGVAGAVAPAVPFQGPGSIRLVADGRMDSALRFDVEIVHAPAGFPVSRVNARGSVEGSLLEPSAALRLDVQGEVDALSLAMLALHFPEVPFDGVAAGRFTARGPLDDVEVTVEAETPGGVILADGRFDAFEPGAHYRVEASVEDFLVSALREGMPEPTRVSARAFVDGRGLDPETMWATAWLEVGRSRAGHFTVDSAATFLRVENGLLAFDTIVVETSVVDAAGSGALALVDGAPEGELRVAFRSESLAPVRPFLMGEGLVAADTLTDIERLFQEMDGQDPDELPDQDEIAVEGRLEGDAIIRGRVRDFRTDGTVLFEELVYGEHAVGSARVNFFGAGMGSPEWSATARATVDSLVAFERRFQGAEAEVEYQAREEAGEAHARLRILRDAAEDYRLRATVEHDAAGGVVHLDELTLRFDVVQWNLGAPATIAWSDDAVIVRDFRLIRPGIDGMRLEADGRIPFDGEIDFRLLVDSLNLERVAQLAQMESELRGTLSLALDVGGQTRAPVMTGSVFARDLLYDDFFLSSLEGDLHYGDRVASGNLEAWQGGRQVFTLVGHAPVDLAFRDLESRLLDTPMDVRITVDSFPAANALAFLPDLQEVEGVFTGELDIGGTPRDPLPTGALQLRGGAVTLPELGVRYTNVQANLLLDEGGEVVINAEAESRGQARVEGTVRLDPFSDPGFDLLIVANNFLAVDRRDMSTRVGGEIRLGGRYRAPELSGNVRVEQGVLFLDEFQRAAEVIDLSDPAFFNVVDTAIVALQPLLEAANPFMQNLRVDVDLIVARDMWLRSREINVEIGGELTVSYDRNRNEILLSGSLQAIRGAYTAFGRQFQVRQGTVDFVGTPGIDPNLNIEAVNRLRRQGGEPLDIIATVTGRLTSPRVNLSSEAQPPIAESDLVSYLIFGRPSYALASGERSLLQGTTGAIGTFGAGALASQLGSIFAQRVGIDYFAVTQADAGPDGGIERSFGGAFAGTQAEVGHYFFEDLFVAVIARPPVGAQGQSLNWLQGVRAEWRFADLWAVESFFEDRFSSAGVLGFTDQGIQFSKVFGLSLFREWGY